MRSDVRRSHRYPLISISVFELLFLVSLDPVHFLSDSNLFSASVLRVEFLHAGLQLVSSGADGVMKVWTIKNNEVLDLSFHISFRIVVFPLTFMFLLFFDDFLLNLCLSCFQPFSALQLFPASPLIRKLLKWKEEREMMKAARVMRMLSSTNSGLCVWEMTKNWSLVEELAALLHYGRIIRRSLFVSPNFSILTRRLWIGKNRKRKKHLFLSTFVLIVLLGLVFCILSFTWLENRN